MKKMADKEEHPRWVVQHEKSHSQQPQACTLIFLIRFDRSNLHWRQLPFSGSPGDLFLALSSWCLGCLHQIPWIAVITVSYILIFLAVPQYLRSSLHHWILTLSLPVWYFCLDGSLLCHQPYPSTYMNSSFFCPSIPPFVRGAHGLIDLHTYRFCQFVPCTYNI